MDTPSQNIGDDIDIRGRKMDFDYDLSTMKKYWNNDSVFSTTFSNAMSCQFPEGERFFMDSVRHYKDLITDPLLQKQIKGFIHQEAMHGNEHDLFNKFIADCGYPVDAAEKVVKRDLKWVRKLLPKSFHLAITCALEHFTAILANQILKHPEFTQGMDPQVKALWIWHAIEETEHKAVAFDVYERCVSNYWIRVITMFIVTISFQLRTFFIQVSFLRADKKLFCKQVYKDAYRYYFKKPGFFASIYKDYFDYYRPSFHPWQHDNRHYIDDWKAKNSNFKTI